MGSTQQHTNGNNNEEQPNTHNDIKASSSNSPDGTEFEPAQKSATESPAPEHVREPKDVTITDLELRHLKKEVHEYKDKYLRVLAESENARKRLQKEKQELIQYALQNVIVDFLNPIDHMENALKFTQQMSDEVKHWAVGFQMILTQFKDVLTNNGVAPFVSEGKPFDPHFHEAIESVETADSPPGIVIEESLRGYKMGDRVIRPARVKVAKAPTSTVKEKER